MPDKKPTHGYVIVYAGLMAAGFTAAIMALQVVTSPIVERNRRLLYHNALVSLFGLGDPERMTPDEVETVVQNQVEQKQKLLDPKTGREFPLLRAFDGRGELIGYAFPISGVGFWARIEGLLAVTADLERTLGVVFLSHGETPGLGGRITTDEFGDQFKGLLVSAPAEARKYIYVGGGKPAGREARSLRAGLLRVPRPGKRRPEGGQRSARCQGDCAPEEPAPPASLPSLSTISHR